MKIKIAPSILSANFGKLNEEIASVEKFVDMLHIDIMDGHFVSNITIGLPVLRCLKTKLPLDLHLMIENSENYIENFVKAGAYSITVHQEACPNLRSVLKQIRYCGAKSAVALNPSTSVQMIEEVLNLVDMVLIMSVNPGFGGQQFIETVLDKITYLRKIKPKLDIQVDGGINDITAKLCVNAGANILVAGSYIFNAKNRKEAILKLKSNKK